MSSVTSPWGPRLALPGSRWCAVATSRVRPFSLATAALPPGGRSSTSRRSPPPCSIVCSTGGWCFTSTEKHSHAGPSCWSRVRASAWSSALVDQPGGGVASPRFLGPQMGNFDEQPWRISASGITAEFRSMSPCSTPGPRWRSLLSASTTSRSVSRTAFELSWTLGGRSEHLPSGRRRSFLAVETTSLCRSRGRQCAIRMPCTQRMRPVVPGRTADAQSSALQSGEQLVSRLAGPHSVRTRLIVRLSWWPCGPWHAQK